MPGAAIKRLSLSLISLACWGGDAHGASEGAVKELLPLSLGELLATPVVTASRHLETSAESPAHIMVFTRDQIRERRYRNLADLLEDLPGVDFQRGTKSAIYNNARYSNTSAYFQFQTEWNKALSTI